MGVKIELEKRRNRSKEKTGVVSCYPLRSWVGLVMAMALWRDG